MKMKRSLFALCLCATAVLSLRGDVLYWIVNEDVAEDFDYTYAKVKNLDEGIYLTAISGEGDTGIADIPKEAFADGEGMFAGLDRIQNIGDNYRFLIELYDDSGLLAHGEGKSFVELSSSIGISGKTEPGELTAWTGGSFKAVPEPTSGLMLLLGTALLALRRKRA